MANQRGAEHNKKRNAGLLYEFLVREISRALVEQDHSRGTKALKILKRWYKPTTQIYREFRLAHSLMKTHVSTPGVAVNILSEAKNAVRSIDYMKLNREKSLLIKDINHVLGGGQIWEQRIPNYKQWATIQTLFNDWATPSSSLQRIAEFEDTMVNWLTEQRKEDKPVLTELSKGETKLVLSIMEKKLNEKWGNALTSVQKELVREWALFSSGDTSKIVDRLGLIKSELHEVAMNYVHTDAAQNAVIKEKVTKLIEAVNKENLSELNDSLISRFMMYSQLVDEIKSEE